MIVIAFEKNKILGGYGDRIVGLISCKLIANLLNQPFAIIWNKENIKEYIDYSKYDFEKKNIKLQDVKVYNLIDNQERLKNHLINSTQFFSNNINKFYLNQEISQYLYKNQLFCNRNYHHDIINQYKKLYTKILKPSPKLIEIVNSICLSNSNIIGIQIRGGDFYMKKEKPLKPIKTAAGCMFKVNEIYQKLLSIKKICQNKYTDYHIFITSDCSNTYQEASKIWEKSKIIYYNKPINHLDISNKNISKVFVDNYILSQKTMCMYISEYSNFGRIAAISSTHSNIFDIDSKKKLKIENLLSKKENY